MPHRWGWTVVTGAATKDTHLRMQRAQQRWAHACNSRSELQRALADPECTAIEVDVRLGGRGAQRDVPIAAHGKGEPSDLTIAELLARIVADSMRHLKLDFKEAPAIEPTLAMLAARRVALQTNGQGVWLNADVLPGPNCEGPCPVSTRDLVPLYRRMCPWAMLSLGWCIGIFGSDDAYSDANAQAMAEMCQREGLDGTSVVFAASLRYAVADVHPLVRLLHMVPGSQLLLWTGKGEVAVRARVVRVARARFGEAGVLDRVGFDVQVTDSCMQSEQSRVVDCVWKRLRQLGV